MNAKTGDLRVVSGFRVLDFWLCDVHAVYPCPNGVRRRPPPRHTQAARHAVDQKGEEERVDDLFENVVGCGGEGRQELVAKQVEGQGLDAFGEVLRLDFPAVDGTLVDRVDGLLSASLGGIEQFAART